MSLESQELLSKDVVQRNYEYLEKKENRIKELGSRVTHDFQPQRSNSRLSQHINDQALS
jgi:hypothetical protein